MQEEIWKDIKGYEKIYQISNLGRIKSLKRKNNYGKTIKESIRILQINKYGYNIITLWKNHIGITYQIHRLVADAFIPNPENKPQVNHIDGNKLNNNINNLQWCTCQENVIHRFKKLKQKGSRSMLGKFGANHNCSKKIYQIDTITYKILKKYNCITEAAKENNINISSISSCLRGRYKSAGGYIWRYVDENNNKFSNNSGKSK